MRSQIIFQARERIGNRYKLCHAVARVTRCLHFSSSNTEDAISDAFLRVAHVTCVVEDAAGPAGAATAADDGLFFKQARTNAWTPSVASAPPA